MALRGDASWVAAQRNGPDVFGIADIPPIDLYLDEGGFEHVLGGSVGVGEIATVLTAAAICNAVRNATGVRPSQVPLRPDRLLGLLSRRTAA